MFGKYTKGITALVVPLMGAIGAIIISPAGHISASEWFMVASALLTGAGVTGLANKP